MKNTEDKWEENCISLNPYRNRGFMLTGDEVNTAYQSMVMLYSYGGDFMTEPEDLEFLEKVKLVIKKIERIWKKEKLN